VGSAFRRLEFKSLHAIGCRLQIRRFWKISADPEGAVKLSLNFEVEEYENVVLFWIQPFVHSRANFDEVGFVPLKILKPREIGMIGETRIGIEF
jgi:hypothetical protein